MRAMLVVFLGAGCPPSHDREFLGYAVAADGDVDVASLVSFTSDSAFFGYGVAFVPDWTGDGGSEVALGDVGYAPTPGQTPGRVAVFFSEGF